MYCVQIISLFYNRSFLLPLIIFFSLTDKSSSFYFCMHFRTQKLNHFLYPRYNEHAPLKCFNLLFSDKVKVRFSRSNRNINFIAHSEHQIHFYFSEKFSLVAVPSLYLKLFITITNTPPDAAILIPLLMYHFLRINLIFFGDHSDILLVNTD